MLSITFSCCHWRVTSGLQHMKNIQQSIKNLLLMYLTLCICTLYMRKGCEVVDGAVAEEKMKVEIVLRKGSSPHRCPPSDWLSIYWNGFPSSLLNREAGVLLKKRAWINLLTCSTCSSTLALKLKSSFWIFQNCFTYMRLDIVLQGNQ